MSDGATALTLQMLDWMRSRPRGYEEIMEAWRTSCPRLSIWEDACIAGLIACDRRTGKYAPSAKGLALLKSNGAGGAIPNARADIAARR